MDLDLERERVVELHLLLSAEPRFAGRPASGVDAAAYRHDGDLSAQPGHPPFGHHREPGLPRASWQVLDARETAAVSKAAGRISAVRSR